MALAGTAAAVSPTGLGRAGDYEVRVTPGANGLLDASVEFARAGQPPLRFAGFDVTLSGPSVAVVPGAARPPRDESTPGVVAFRHTLLASAGACELGIALRVERGALRVERGALRADCSLDRLPKTGPWASVRIEAVRLGSWSERPRRIFAGAGNVLVAPGKFRLPYDGHFLATSFAGYEFGRGPAIVQAVSVPPDALEVDGPARRASLEAPLDQTIWVIPGRTAWEAAAVWRDLDGRAAASGVGRLAGRLVFDCWAGRYAEAAQALERSFRYGLTDAVVIWHQWQRWGYDFRLPDIWPPDPELGTTAEFAALAAACRARGALFAPHDNYIDAYPDSDGYTPDNIAHAQDHAPVKAWYNAWRKAQAFRFRPDRFQPFLERNLASIRPGVAPTAYFVDVFASIGLYDGWTRDGAFFDRRLTRQRWGEAFDRIRQALDGAPTVSESGHDALIGHLDGATANHLRVDPAAPESQWSVWRSPCADAERIPWLDFVHHQRFAVHGAGYGDRFAGGLEPAVHGIESDDYLSVEAMTGHPPMVSGPFGREAVRAGWLLGPAGRALAGRRMLAVEFAGGDIHRQVIRWEGGGTVAVNRGTSDWTREGRVLPQYGFHLRLPAAEGFVEAAIERRAAGIAEWATSPGAWYVNARPPDRRSAVVAAPAPVVRPDGTVAMGFRWTARRPTDRPARIFVHFTDAAGDILFQGDHDAGVSTTAWTGTVLTSTETKLPAAARPGAVVDLRVGLYDSAGREPLEGRDDGNRRILLGRLHLTGAGDRVSGGRWEPLPQPADPRLARMNAPGTAVTVGAVTTDGGVRLTSSAEGLLVIPLPGSGPMTLQLRPALLTNHAAAWREATALAEDGSHLSIRPLAETGAVRTLACEPAVFAYLLH